MRSLELVRPKTLRWRDADEPVVESAGDAIVRPFIAARCDGDVFFLQHDFERALSLGAALHAVDPAFGSAKTNPFAAPFAYGHECVAEVVSVGADVTRVRVGDIVVVPWAISCGACSTCGAGLTSKCGTARGSKELAAYGFGSAIGGHGGMVSDALRVPFADAMLVPVPSGTDPLALASASDRQHSGRLSNRRTASQRERRKLPFSWSAGGAKSIGLYAAGIAKAVERDAASITSTARERDSISPRRWARIRIERTKRSTWFARGGPPLAGGYPITVDASSTTVGLAFAIDALAPGGTCTGVGFYLRRGTPVPLWKMYMTSATLRVGVSHPRADLPDVLALIASRRFDPSLVTTLVADWDDAPRALLERSTKVVIRRASLGLAERPPADARAS